MLKKTLIALVAACTLAAGAAPAQADLQPLDGGGGFPAFAGVDPHCKSSPAKRFKVVYARPSGVAFNQARFDKIQATMRKTEDLLRNQSQGNGLWYDGTNYRSRQLRIPVECQTGNTQVAVHSLIVPGGNDLYYDPLAQFVKNNYGRGTKYIVFVDAVHPTSQGDYCGQAGSDWWTPAEQWLGLKADPSNYLNNHHNKYDGSSVVIYNDTSAGTPGGCWDTSVVVHELMHVLGAQQPGLATSDSATVAGHCNDGGDVLCAGSNPCAMSSWFGWWLDCRNDSYYAPDNPTSGHVLYNRWQLGHRNNLWIDHFNATEALPNFSGNWSGWTAMTETNGPPPRPIGIASNVTPSAGTTFQFSACNATCSLPLPEPDGEAITYLWDLDGNGSLEVTGGSQPKNLCFETAGTRNLGVAARDPGGRTSDIERVAVTVTGSGTCGGGGGAPPAPSISGPSSLDEDEVGTFTASSSGATSYEWDLDNNGSFETTGNPKTKSWPTAPGPGVLKARACASGSCSSATTKSVTITDLD